jgi:hypothetical protein
MRLTRTRPVAASVSSVPTSSRRCCLTPAPSSRRTAAPITLVATTLDQQPTQRWSAACSDCANGCPYAHASAPLTRRERRQRVARRCQVETLNDMQREHCLLEGHTLFRNLTMAETPNPAPVRWFLRPGRCPPGWVSAQTLTRRHLQLPATGKPSWKGLFAAEAMDIGQSGWTIPGLPGLSIGLDAGRQ